MTERNPIVNHLLLKLEPHSNQQCRTLCGRKTTPEHIVPEPYLEIAGDGPPLCKACLTVYKSRPLEREWTPHTLAEALCKRLALHPAAPTMHQLKMAYLAAVLKVTNEKPSIAAHILDVDVNTIRQLKRRYLA